MPVVLNPRKGNVGMLFENLKLNNENQLKILNDCLFIGKRKWRMRAGQQTAVFIAE